MPEREPPKDLEHFIVESRIAHAGELDFELRNGNRSTGETPPDEKIDLLEDLLRGELSQILSPRVAYGAGYRTSPERRHYEHPFPLTGNGRLHGFRALDEAAVRELDDEHA
jgi:hypothetical protein